MNSYFNDRNKAVELDQGTEMGKSTPARDRAVCLGETRAEGNEGLAFPGSCIFCLEFGFCSTGNRTP